MTKKRIKIDEELCVGCGLCVDACQESVIELVDGKAKVMREDYCDGLGNCLPVCPVGAISFEETELEDTAPAPENDTAAQDKAKQAEGALPCGCPGTHLRKIERRSRESDAPAAAEMPSMLSQWPIQIKLVPVNAPYFDGANLLVAADCTAFAYGDFHRKFIRRHVTLIGCPKLDDVDYTEKLTEIISRNNIKSVTVVRMEVPCCGGIEHAVKRALAASGKLIPWQIVTISTDGEILE
ncbi:MAG: ATP-binding protein [Eubacteriales bacterium]|nr:4Fe-4S binding protein [Clostridiales bacterium]